MESRADCVEKQDDLKRRNFAVIGISSCHFLMKNVCQNKNFKRIKIYQATKPQFGKSVNGNRCSNYLSFKERIV